VQAHPAWQCKLLLLSKLIFSWLSNRLRQRACASRAAAVAAANKRSNVQRSCQECIALIRPARQLRLNRVLVQQRGS
jgi:hypothetical protein